MPPEFNFGDLSKEDLVKIVAAGEQGAGHLAYQYAQVRLVQIESRVPSLEQNAFDPTAWMRDIPTQDRDNIERILKE